MTTFKWLLLNAVLWSFTAGLIKSRIDWEAKAENQAPVNQGYIGEVEPTKTQDWQIQGKAYNPADPNVPPVVDRTEGFEPDPKATRETVPGEDPKLETPPAYTLFVKGERITCIYDGVFSWSDGQEFMKTVAMDCKVIEASEGWNDVPFEGANYQHIKVDCSKGLERKWTSQPGVGMVKDHALNFRQRWFTSRECYHFVTED